MLKTATCLLALVIAASNAFCQVGQTGQRYGYVFAPDQRYVVIDLVAGRVVGSGAISDVIPVGRPFVAFFGGKLLLQGVKPADKNAPEPREQLAVLNETRGARGVRLSFERWLPARTASSSVIWATVLGGNMLAVSSQDEQIQTKIYDTTFNAVKTLNGFRVTPTTCLSSDGQTIHSVTHGSERQTQTANLRSLAVRQSEYSIGNPTAFYKAPKASDGCVVAFIERMSRATAGPMPATIYLRDVEKNNTLTSFTVAGDGRFALHLKRKLLLLDLTELAANTLPDGTTVGLRRASMGSLLLYDTMSGKETSRIALPVNGELAAVSVDGNTAYYLSPNLLTVIDLVNNRVAAKVTLPFPYGIFVAASEKRAAPSAEQPSRSSSRKSACGCYACGVLLAVNFPNKSPDCFGILATDACPQELAQMPDKGIAYCKEIKSRSKDRSFVGCHALAGYCDSLVQD